MHRRSAQRSISNLIVVLLVLISLCPFSQIATASGTWEEWTPLPHGDVGLAESYNGKIYAIGDWIQVYTEANDTWTVLDSSSIGYRGGSARIGDRIYIVDSWSKAMYYDIPNNTFVDIPDPSHRLDYKVAALDGILYVTGGWHSGNTTSRTDVEAYNPANDTWWFVAPMNVGRSHHQSVGLDGYVYSIGGKTEGGSHHSVERYDPDTNTWTFVASTVDYHASFGATVHKGNIVINDGGSDIGSEVYLPELDQWNKGPSIPMSNYYNTPMASLGDYVYSIGGRKASGEVHVEVFRWDVVLTTGNPPTAPRDLTASAGDGYVQLTWLPPLNDSGFPVMRYNIYRGNTASTLEYFKKIDNVTGSNDTEVINGWTYYYKVAAVNMNGEGPKSNIVDATPIGEGDPPTEPIDLEAEAGDRYVQLSWQPPVDQGGSEIANYMVYKSGSKTNLSFLSDAYGLEYNDTKVTNGITYYYAVSALNSAGKGPSSDIVMATPGEPPTAPRELIAISGNGTVNLTWLPPLDDKGFPIYEYHIFRGSGPSTLALYNIQGDMTWFTDDDVFNGTTYHYAVAAMNSKGRGDMSEVVNATPVGVPDSPRDLTADPGDGYVDLEWTAPVDTGGMTIMFYRIFRWEDGSPMGLLDEIQGTGYNDTDVVNGKIYNYAVSAVNPIGESDLSEPVSTTPEGTPMDTISPTVTITGPFNGSTLTKMKSRVSGTSSDNREVQKVEISTDGTNWKLANGTTSWARGIELKEGNNTIYARATDLAGNTRTTSVIVTVKISTEPPPPPVVQTTSDLFFWVVLIIIIIAILLIIVIYNVINASRTEEEVKGPPRP